MSGALSSLNIPREVLLDVYREARNAFPAEAIRLLEQIAREMVAE